MPSVNPQALADYLQGGANGLNRSILTMADTLIGNPVSGLANTLGADIERNPITRTMQGYGVGAQPRPGNEALASAITGTAGDVVAGFIPVAGDIAGLKQDWDAYKSGNLPNWAIPLALAGALPFFPPAARYVADRLPDGAMSPSPDAFGRNEIGALMQHATPHTWAPEPGFPEGRPRYDSDVALTGEGANAYGAGLYASDVGGAAETHYFPTFSRNAGAERPPLMDGKPFDGAIPGVSQEQAERAARMLSMTEGDAKSAADSLRERIADARTLTIDGMPWPDAYSKISDDGLDALYNIDVDFRQQGQPVDYNPVAGLRAQANDALENPNPQWGDMADPVWLNELADFAEKHQIRVDTSAQDEVLKAADWLEQNASRFSPDNSARLYEFDFPDEQMPNLLDWDKPLSEQPEVVRNALERTGQETGARAYQELSQQLSNYPDVVREMLELAEQGKLTMNGDGQQVVSDWLQAKGIPGIRFLDGGSRRAGEGTSNYTLFRPQDYAQDVKRVK